jgi:hypothetical protein
MMEQALDEWWFALSLRDAVQVMREEATLREFRRLHSDRAARTWWSSLSVDRKAQAYRNKMGEDGPWLITHTSTENEG